MAGVSVHIPAAAMELTAFDQKEMAATRMKRRVYDILNKAAQRPADRCANGRCQGRQHCTVQSTRNSAKGCIQHSNLQIIFCMYKTI